MLEVRYGLLPQVAAGKSEKRVRQIDLVGAEKDN